MTYFSKCGFAVLLIAFFSLTAVIETNAQQVNKILKRMELHAKALKSLQSNIAMNKHDVLLDENDLKSGTLKYLPSKGKEIYLRIDWIQPVKEVLAIVKDTYVLYQPRLSQAYSGKVSQANKNTKASGVFDIMSMSSAQLKANYQIKFLGTENVAGKNMWHLQLNPKKKVSYKWADVWVDGDGMPIQSKILEKNNDSTTIRLSKIKKNVAVNANVFRVNLPKGAKIIKG